MGIGDMLQAKQDTEDAKRYRWLRQRMEVRYVESVNGEKKEGLSVRVGCAFFDSDTVERNPPRDYTLLDQYIDSARRRSGGQ